MFPMFVIRHFVTRSSRTYVPISKFMAYYTVDAPPLLSSAVVVLSVALVVAGPAAPAEPPGPARPTGLLGRLRLRIGLTGHVCDCSNCSRGFMASSGLCI